MNNDKNYIPRTPATRAAIETRAERERLQKERRAVQVKKIADHLERLKEETTRIRTATKPQFKIGDLVIASGTVGYVSALYRFHDEKTWHYVVDQYLMRGNPSRVFDDVSRKGVSEFLRWIPYKGRRTCEREHAMEKL